MFTYHLRVLSVALAATFLFSCGKESSVEPDTKGSSPIIGNYKIVYTYQKGHSQTTVKIGTETDGAINDFVFTGSNFTGTYVIDDKSIAYSNVGYTVTGPITAESFTNGISDGEPFTMDFHQTLPPMSVVAPYQIKGDSIYSAPITTTSTGNLPANTSGLSDVYAQHWKFSGDTLIIDGNMNIANRIVNIQGYNATMSSNNYVVIKLLRIK
ncbi:hypothetical protein [Chitinophaga sp. Cy-1792]|uniref:hypothetical protein n=1 Tax=Chitinophaga sp. Cy-1792 TaxID=2608339 RepID=UPI0014244503|nr:hypothetical protein [Chitinophaga sp. Cy-1792]NIG57218.1 hypothetical protein [Chitinophaga sp. Cy-1792]